MITFRTTSVYSIPLKLSVVELIDVSTVHQTSNYHSPLVTVEVT